MLTEALPIYKDSEDLINTLLDCTKEFSKFFKYTFGEYMMKECIELLRQIQHANISTKNRVENIENFLIQFNTIKAAIRICTERGEIGNAKAAQLAILTDKIGRQANGWRSKYITEEENKEKDKGASCIENGDKTEQPF